MTLVWDNLGAILEIMVSRVTDGGTDIGGIRCDLLDKVLMQSIHNVPY